MLKILLDPQIFNEQLFGGISRYYTEIYSEIKKNKHINIDCPLLYTENIHFKESQLFLDSYQHKMNLFIKYGNILKYFSPRKLKRRNQKHFVKLLEQGEFDVFVPTYYDTSFLSYTQKPFVLTVYDMIHEIFPQYFTNDTVTVPNKKLLLEKASKVIAISQSTKADILTIYPHISAEKIEVVPLSYSIKPPTEKKPDLPDKYLLFVGNRWVYKNFTFFIKAVSSLLREDPELVLVCAGGNRFTEDELNLIAELNLTDKVVQQNFEDNELYHYYKNALCFIFPSEYEGFGIPVLEAMACDCPVILANHSSFPEVAGEAGLYFELNNASDLKMQVSALVNNQELRSHYIQLGSEQIKKFSWEKTANECLEVFKKAQ
jgi:glycosyltransferase involved in cell wall biosynthesis